MLKKRRVLHTAFLVLLRIIRKKAKVPIDVLTCVSVISRDNGKKFTQTDRLDAISSFRAQGFGKFADRCKEEAEEEPEEARKCTQRVVALGDKPVLRRK